MNLFKQTKGIVDRIIGAKKRSAIEKEGGLLDPMQNTRPLANTMWDQKMVRLMARSLS